MKLVKLCGDTYYVPGLTNIGVYGDYVIDPGKNENVDWEKPEVSFGRAIRYALITHGHNDHFWHASDLRNRGAKVYAPAGERPMIESIDIHVNGFFLWVKPPEGMKPWYFRGTPCPVDGPVEEPDMPLKIVPLPGHTDWQAGYMTPDGVLMAGDALAAKKAWEKAFIVYNTSVPLTRRTLKELMDTDADMVLPSHTEPLTREETVELAEANLKGLDRVENAVLNAISGSGLSTEEVVSKVCLGFKLREDFNVQLVAETVVRSFLYSLYDDGSVDYELKGHKVLWRKK
jgi:glyoxylase-like metal-dependent hydrolase (beta-lactamase superfamily II)